MTTIADMITIRVIHTRMTTTMATATHMTMITGTTTIMTIATMGIIFTSEVRQDACLRC